LGNNKEPEVMNLQRAIEIAVEAHRGMTDKGGNPYILHPLRVMQSLFTEEEQIVGVLHDVVEDCEGWTFARLKNEGFSENVLEALASVTKSNDDKNYDEFINRALKNSIGRKVKIADIVDNLDVRRIDEIAEKDVARLQKYKRALSLLSES
jgi:(p)ppGpp synthase/HD superfamily hydrolase